MGGLWAAVFVQVKETRGSGGGGVEAEVCLVLRSSFLLV